MDNYFITIYLRDTKFPENFKQYLTMNPASQIWRSAVVHVYTLHKGPPVLDFAATTSVTVSPSPTCDSPRDYTPTADIPFVASANTPEDPWWDWQAEEDPHIQERVWAAIEALEDTARAGRLSRASSTALSSGLYNNSITSLLVGVTSKTRPSTIFPYSALSEPVQPLYTLPLHLLILCLAYIGHALRITLAVAYGILKTRDTVAAANRHTWIANILVLVSPTFTRLLASLSELMTLAPTAALHKKNLRWKGSMQDQKKKRRGSTSVGEVWSQTDPNCLKTVWVWRILAQTEWFGFRFGGPKPSSNQTKLIKKTY
ncbi:hypothetical protein EDB85DRAFT_1889113 [Lactarius pseudohatsudake]|nr:hypothetical protein EDB85DRAFT_1889113 [Lactarius pseudohatsudake]